jgi:hypothetical protein
MIVRCMPQWLPMLYRVIGQGRLGVGMIFNRGHNGLFVAFVVGELVALLIIVVGGIFS